MRTRTVLTMTGGLVLTLLLSMSQAGLAGVRELPSARQAGGPRAHPLDTQCNATDCAADQRRMSTSKDRVTITGTISWTAKSTNLGPGYTGGDKESGTFTVDEQSTVPGPIIGTQWTSKGSAYTVTDTLNEGYTVDGCTTTTTGNTTASGSLADPDESRANHWHAIGVGWGPPYVPWAGFSIGINADEVRTTTIGGSDCGSAPPPYTDNLLILPGCANSSIGVGAGAISGKFKGKGDNGTISIKCTQTEGTVLSTADGTLKVTSKPPVAQAAAVRFASLAKTAPGTPGLPVIKDDGTSQVMDHGWGPETCPGLARPKDYDWLACAAGGTPDKDWPVIYSARDHLKIDTVVLVSSSKLTDAKLTATATIGGQTLTLPSTGLTSTEVDGKHDLTADGLTFKGDLPGEPGVDQLAILWTVTTAGGSTPAGVSASPVYLTAAPYKPPAGMPGSGIKLPVPPYMSLLEVGTQAAAGQADPETVFRAILAKFATRDIAHPILDPETGQVKDGPDLLYYTNGYTTIGDWWNHPFGYCPGFDLFLATNSGHCGNWAEYLAAVLAYQGIPARYVGLGNESGFYPGPAPGSSATCAKEPAVADCYAWMLIGPPLWSFTTKNSAGPYPYEDILSVTDGKVTVSGKAFTYTPSSAAIAQGGVRTPPEMFYTGDHAIVDTQWGYADPSYGQPQDASPYLSITPYEKSAIAGFAVIYAKVNGSYVPLLPGHIGTCAATPCEFRAVPYNPPG